jgi:cysteine synthase B
MESYISYVKDRRPDIFGLETQRRMWYDISEDEILEAPALSVEELRVRTSSLVVDTRSTVAFELEHIPGALNYPLEDLERVMRSGVPFPSGTELVFVCQHGILTRPLAAFLYQKGFSAYSLEGGYRAWRAANQHLQASIN